MSLQALLWVVTAAVLHATWNLITKQVNGKLPFFWLMAMASSVICLPFVVWEIMQLHLTPGITVWKFALGSAVLHLLYFIILQTGYRKADLSVVYPLARGSGPFISVIGAILLFGEKPGWLAVSGIVMIITGVLVMTGLRIKNVPDQKLKNGIVYGCLTGLFIASYTLWDRVAVVDNKVPALFITFGSMVLPLILLMPVAIRQHTEVKREIRQHWKQALVIAVCQPLSYLLVLFALRTTPVTYVAPARELSIVFGVFFGANFLQEKDAKRRIIASVVMLLGIILLALG